ncbi:unnamed protein product [Urochloa humidicola]
MEFHVPVPPPGAGAAAGAAPPAPVPAAAEPPWRSPVKARVALAKALIVLGFAAAELALISITLSPETSRFMGACAPTDAEAAELRAGAELLLLASAAEVLASTVAVLAPARPCALAATALAVLTAYRASGVLHMLAACHGHLHGAHGSHFVLLLAALLVALLVAVVVSVS